MPFSLFFNMRSWTLLYVQDSYSFQVLSDLKGEYQSSIPAASLSLDWLFMSTSNKHEWSCFVMLLSSEAMRLFDACSRVIWNIKKKIAFLHEVWCMSVFLALFIWISSFYFFSFNFPSWWIADLSSIARQTNFAVDCSGNKIVLLLMVCWFLDGLYNIVALAYLTPCLCLLILLWARHRN